MEEKICARVRLYMGSPRWMNLVTGLLPDVSSMREMVFVKRTVIRRWYGWKLRWKTAFIYQLESVVANS